jgi:hypothetical protein
VGWAPHRSIALLEVPDVAHRDQPATRASVDTDSHHDLAKVPIDDVESAAPIAKE